MQARWRAENLHRVCFIGLCGDFSCAMGLDGSTDYASEVKALIGWQLSGWTTATHNYAALKRAQIRTLNLGSTQVVLQHNPDRIRSSAAKIDPESIKARNCFLCTENQPKEQEIVDWRGLYKIQVNPFPIFPRHLTVASYTHTPQAISGRMGHMLALAADLENFVVFYNGPRCGASAPDHFHFQAGNKGFLPLPDEALNSARKPVVTMGECEVSLMEGLCRPFFLIDSTSASDAEAAFEAVEAAMPVKAGDYEPMQNLLCWSDGGVWHIVVFPRTKHRPSCYGEGKGQFVLSPASVDMGGVMAVPRKCDFESLTAESVRQIFGEVCASEAETGEITDRIKNEVRSGKTSHRQNQY